MKNNVNDARIRCKTKFNSLLVSWICLEKRRRKRVLQTIRFFRNLHLPRHESADGFTDIEKQGFRANSSKVQERDVRMKREKEEKERNEYWSTQVPKWFQKQEERQQESFPHATTEREETKSSVKHQNIQLSILCSQHGKPPQQINKNIWKSLFRKASSWRSKEVQLKNMQFLLHVNVT